MTEETQQLAREIKALKKVHTRHPTLNQGAVGYNAALTILTDLLGCIFIGCAIGLFFQYIFHTSVLLTAGLTILGGVSGLYSTARYAIRLEQNQAKKEVTDKQ